MTTLTDEQIEQLLTGGPSPEGYDELASTFASLRDATAAQPAVPVSAQLGEFVRAPPVGVPQPMSPSNPASPLRRPPPQGSPRC